jgi:hypothetical protein
MYDTETSKRGGLGPIWSVAAQKVQKNLTCHWSLKVLYSVLRVAFNNCSDVTELCQTFESNFTPSLCRNFAAVNGVVLESGITSGLMVLRKD